MRQPDPSWRHNWQQWRVTPLRAQLYVLVTVAAAVAVTVWNLPSVARSHGTALTLAVLAVGSVTNIELGRWLEGRRLERDRTHKGLSAWPFAAALLLPAGMAGCIALIAYAHMRLRGIHITLWKWVLSWTAVTLGSAAAARVIETVSGRLPPIGSGRAMIAIALAAAAFLATETSVFFVISRLNTAGDEVHLRRALASLDFYVTEVVVLASAATAAVLVRYSPWIILLTVPGYVQLQRAVIYRALREEARIDGKTGLLNSETWRTEAVTAWEHARRRGRGLAVLLTDLDHFKSVNDTHGHVLGDDVLVATAATLVDIVRQDDLVGRFGGEEFCIVLRDADRDTALAAAERIRSQIECLTFSPANLRVTISVGLAVADWTDNCHTLSELIAIADQKLYEAKNEGRNRVRC